MIRVDVPDHGTFVEFPDGTDPVEIQNVLAQSFPARSTGSSDARNRFIEAESANTEAEKSLYRGGSNPLFSSADSGTPQQVMGISTPSGMKAAKTARTTVPRLAKDSPKLLAMGVDNIGIATGQGMDFLGMHDTGRKLKEIYQGRQEETSKTLDPETQRIQETPVYDDETGQWNTDVAPEKFFTGAVQSAPEMLATIAPTTWGIAALTKLGAVGKIASAARKLGAGEKLAQYTAEFLTRGAAGGAVEGVQAGLDNAAQTEQKIRQASLERLQELPSFQDAYAATDANLPEDERAAQARDAIANKAAWEVFLRTIPSTGGLGLITGGGASGMLSEKLALKTMAKEAGKTARRGMLGAVKNTAEGFAEEALQEGLQSPAEQYIENIAEQKYLDQNRNPMSGVVNSAVEGAGSGGLMGAVGGGASHLLQAPERHVPVMDHESFSDTSDMPAPTGIPAGMAPSGPLSRAVAKANLPVPVNTIRVTPEGNALTQDQYSPLTTTPGMSVQDIEASRQKISGMAGPAFPQQKTSTDELLLDEARDWAKNQIMSGTTYLMRQIGETQQAYAQRMLNEYKKLQSRAQNQQPTTPLMAADVATSPEPPAAAPVPRTEPFPAKPDPDLETISSVTDVDRDNLALARDRAKLWERGSRTNGPSNKLELFPWLTHWGKTTPAEIAASIENFLAGKKLGPVQQQLLAETIRGERDRVEREATLQQPEQLAPNRVAGGDLRSRAEAYAKAAGDYNLEGMDDKAIEDFVRSWDDYHSHQATASAPIDAPAAESADGDTLRKKAQVYADQANYDITGWSDSDLSEFVRSWEEYLAEKAKNGEPLTLNEAAHEAASSPLNETPEPSPAQIEAGNYKKGHVRLHGLDISIENPAGSVRRGTDPSGAQWETELNHHYGYLRGTVGRDKDHIDVFIGPNPESAKVYVVDQVDPASGRFDEHKVMLGFDSSEGARQGYLANYDETGPQRIGSVTEALIEDFKDWLNAGDTRKPFSAEGNHEVPEVLQESREGEKEVPDLREEDERAVPGSLAGDEQHRSPEVAPREQSGPAAGSHKPTTSPSTKPATAEGPATASSPAGGRDPLGAFVKAPGGGIDFGTIDAEVSAALRRQAGPIRLRVGDEKSGQKHIERKERLAQLAAEGYTSAAAVVDAVAKGYSVIYKGEKGNLLLVKRNGRDSVLYIQLEPSEGGDYYDVKSATVARKDFFKNKEPLWERAQSDQSPKEPPLRDLSGQSGSEKQTGGKTTTDTLAVAGKDDTASPPAGSDSNIVSNPAKNVKKVAESGEELRYNKRNRIRAGLRWEDVKDTNDALKAKEVVKANIWAKPDYDQLIADGMEPVVAHIVKQVYDSIAVKPQVRGVPSDADFQRFITAVGRVEKGITTWMKNREAIAAWFEKQAKNARAFMPGEVTNLTELAAKVPTPLDAVYPDGWKEHRDEIHILGGNKALGALQPGFDEVRRAIRDIEKGWPAKQEAWQKQGISIMANEGFAIEEVKQPGDRGSVFFIRKREPGSSFRYIDVGHAYSRAQAEEKLAELKDFLLFDKRKRLVDSFATMDEAREAARLSVKRDGTAKPIDEGMNISEAERSGKEHRLAGRDVTSDEIRETFGFKGVNFGNYVPNNERQAHLNHAYDAALDLVEVLNIPPKALSLNATLGVAFGAQGNGGASGHFVPGLNEINLTRTRGAGVFSHEWAHALDAYFGDQAGFGAAPKPYLSNFLKAGPKGEIRPEVLSAYRTIMEVMRSRQETPQEAAERVAQQEKQAREWKEKSLAKWKQRFDEAGKAEDFAPLLDRMEKGEYGEGRVAVSKTKHVFPVVAEVGDLARKAKLRLSEPLPDALQRLHYDLYRMELTDEPRTIRTGYYRASLAADSGKKTPYWSTPWEMFARAFDAYVTDLVEQRGDHNTYLSGLEAVSPLDEDRKRINAAFQTLFDELKTRETEKGIALFAREERGLEASPIPKVEFDAILHRITAGLNAEERGRLFEVVDSPLELPAAILEEAERQGTSPYSIDGVYHGGKVYVVRDQIATADRLEEVLFHEWHGHHGLKGLFGPQYRKSMLELYNHIGAGPMFAIGKKYGINLMKYGQALVQAGYDRDTRRIIMAEEMLAHLTNEYSRPGIAKRVREVIGQVREWLREHGFAQLAQWGENDIAWLLKRARAYAEAGAGAEDGGTVFASRKDMLERLAAKGISEAQLRDALAALPTFAAAWHGTPHEVERFSTAHIGTGEGAQAFGWGLYFAGAKEVAEHYRNTLGPGRGLDVGDIAARIYQTLPSSMSENEKTVAVVNELQARADSATSLDFKNKMQREIRAVELGKHRANLYQVELAPREDEYLLWDAPLNRQSEAVLSALGGEIQSMRDLYRYGDPTNMTGAEFYRGLEGTPADASRYLNALGIKGIKYRDGLSRDTGGYRVVWENGRKSTETFNSKEQAEILGDSLREEYGQPNVEWEDDPEGTHNYVIFDDKDVEITARFALRKDLDQVSPAGLVKKIGKFLNPLDYSRFHQAAQKHLPESAKAFLGDVLQTPFWKKESDPSARPFYDEFADREVRRFDNNIRMFGGLVDQEGKRTAMEKLRSVIQWTDKVTRWGKLREDMYEPLSKKEKAAYDVIRFEGDAYNKVYGSLQDALRNPRIKAAGLNERTFAWYQEALRMEEESFHIMLQIVKENMEEAGVDPEKIKGHIAEFRARYAERKGYVNRNHGKGDYVVQVRRVIDRLDFNVDVVQHQGETTDRIRLAYYPGHALAKEIEKIAKQFGASFKQTQNGALIMLFKEGAGERALSQLKAIDLEKEPGEHYKVLVYSRFLNSEAAAEKLAVEVRGDLSAAMPRNFREGHKFETSWKFSDKVQEYEFEAIQASDMEVERILTDALKRAQSKGDISDEEYHNVQQEVVQATAETLLSRGAGLYQIRRASYLIEGYDTTDAIGKYQDYVNGVAGMLSKARYALRQYKHLQNVPPKTRPWAFRYVQDSLRNMGWADRLSGDARAFASIWYLGMSASWMLVNSTQPYTFGQAELSRYTKHAATKIALAEKDVVRGNLTDEEKGLFTREEVLTQERESFQAEMAGQMDGIGGAWSKALHTGARVSLAIGQKVEVLNRRTVILAAYRVFRAQGYTAEAALHKAMEVNSTVNIDMGRHNLPTWARKPAGRTFYTLQSYIMHALNYLYHRSSTGNVRDQKAVLRLLWVMMLMGGLPAGAPGSDELDKFILRYFNYSPKLAFRGFTKRFAKDYGTPGEMLDGFIWHGVPGALKPFGVGFSLTGAIQFRIPFVSNVIAGDDLMSLTGPVGGLLKKAQMGFTQAMRGDWNRAAEYLAPNGIASILSGYRQATEGVMTSHGKRVFYRGTQLKMTPVEGAIRAAGFQPVRTSDISETRSIGRQLSSKWDEEHQDALDEYRIQGTRKGMQDFNRRLRQSQADGLVSPITQETLRRARGGMNRKATKWERRFGLD